MQAFEKLESVWNSWLGERWYSVSVSSGTSALHLALESLNVPPKRKVIVPDFTMIACARAVTMANLTPVFVDCNYDLLMDFDQVPIDFDYETVAMMVVHIYGRVCDMEIAHAIAGRNALYVIEDMAEAHGVKPHPETDVACWSFYKNKIVHGEEGGMIAFKDPEKANQARCLRSQGFTDDHDFNHIPRGVNARMSNLHAQPIIDSFGNMGLNLALRSKLHTAYEALIPEEWKLPNTRTVNWVYDLRIKGMNTFTQDAIVKRLNNLGIQARHGFKSCSWQEEYNSGKFCKIKKKNSISYRMSEEVIYLPITENMSLLGVENNVYELKAAVKSANF